MENREEITARQYAAKIVEVAYFEIMSNKETITNVLEALIKEYADQQNKQQLECTEHIKEVCDDYEKQTKALTDEIEELKRINSNLEARVKSWDKMYKTLLQENLDLQSRISELEKVNDSLKEAFKRGSELNDKLKFD